MTEPFSVIFTEVYEPTFVECLEKLPQFFRPYFPLEYNIGTLCSSKWHEFHTYLSHGPLVPEDYIAKIVGTLP